MVDKKLRKDLVSFGIPVIALGDLWQLPPIFGDPVFLIDPDVILTEIMRQQEGNPIIYLSERARLGLRIERGTYLDKCLVFGKNDLRHEPEIYKRSNAVICRTNNTRDYLNYHIRTNIFDIKSDDLIVGDKLICRKNNWNESLGENIYLINGMVGNVENINMEKFDGRTMEIDFRPEFLKNNYRSSSNIVHFVNIPIDYKYLNLDHKNRKKHVSYVNKFEYGYAITCHLAQGSQYNNVLIYDEKFGDKEFYNKWLYTAITRAVDKLVIAC